MVRSSLAVVVVCVAMWGCAEGPEPPGTPARSAALRITTPPRPEIFSATMAGNTAAALDLYAGLGATDGDLVFSPHSVLAVLGLTAAGARGATHDELFGFLRAPRPADFHRSMNHLERELAARAQPPSGESTERLELLSLNQLFIDSTQRLEPGYLDLVQQEYGLGLHQLDFQRRPAEAREAINAWVRDATKDHIARLLDDEAITRDTKLVLANAVYFSSNWAVPLSTGEPEPFHALGGDVPVPMMKGFVRGRLLETDALRAIELDYAGRAVSLLVLMPKGDFKAWEASLDVEALQSVRQGLLEANLELKLPRYQVRRRADLAPLLRARGVTSVFEEATSDLSAMARPGLFVAELLHEATIEVGEQGTRAVATTAAAVVVPVSGPAPVLTPVWIDRPFVFLVHDRETQAVLFLGRYVTGT